MSEKRYWDETIETLPRPRLIEYQTEHLRKTFGNGLGRVAVLQAGVQRGRESSLKFADAWRICTAFPSSTTIEATVRWRDRGRLTAWPKRRWFSWPRLAGPTGVSHAQSVHQGAISRSSRTYKRGRVLGHPACGRTDRSSAPPLNSALFGRCPDESAAQKWARCASGQGLSRRKRLSSS